MLNAAVAKPAAPGPAPLYNLPKPDPIEDYSDNFITDMQYICLGAIFGILGTLLYWRCARL